MTTPPVDEETEDFLARYERAGRVKSALAILIAMSAALGLGWLLFGARIERAWRRAALAVAEEERLANMTTLERVHAELLPAWTISLSNDRPDVAERHAALLEALGEDPHAVKLFGALAEQVSDRDRLVERGDEILETVELWNRYLDRAGQPWWVDANIRSSPRNTFFYVKTYKVLGDLEVDLAGPRRVRFVARADRTNVMESMLGHTSEHQDGAIILADRLYDFSLREVWPVLGEPGEDMTPRERAFGERVRAEVRATVPAEAYERLARHAATRRRLERTLRAIRDRRECGSTFSIIDLPWSGMPERDIDALRRYAARDRHADCPAITDDEIDAIVEASEVMRDDAELKTAAEALVAHVARGVTVHEARHTADFDAVGGFDEVIPCGWCDEHQLGRSTRAELSAYLASFATPGVAYTALYQACSIGLDRATPHALAMRIATSEVGLDCDAPPQDLTERARAAQQRLFGRADAATLPEDFPARLELYRQR